MCKLKFLLLIFLSSFVFAEEKTKFAHNSSLEIIPKNKLLKSENDYHYFGIKINLDDGWKTYWKNPGDAGAPITVDFENEESLIEKEVLFPFPRKYLENNLITIGYEKEVIFPVRLKFKDNVKNYTSKLNIQYLVCKEICIPLVKSLYIDYSLSSSNRLSIESSIYKYLSKVPFVDQGYFNFKELSFRDSNTIEIVFSNNDHQIQEAFSFSNDISIETKIKIKNKKTYVELNSDESFRDLSSPLILSVSDGQKYEDFVIDPNNVENDLNYSIFKFLFLAFIGGVILNFMPCVLPILSLKVLSLINHVNSERNNIRKYTISTVMGILVSFLILSLLIIAMKSVGTYVGWGFQFQNHSFLITISIIIFLFSVNMLGFYEIILPGRVQNFFDRIINSKNKEHYFLSGMFATLLATPCSAPFLGTAIGFSTITSNYNILLIFTFIAIGFSLPYLIILFKPSIIKILPKPGSWMINFKHFLGIILLITFCWLLQLINTDHRIIIVSFVLLTGLSFVIKKDLKNLILSFLGLMVVIFFFIKPLAKEGDKLIWIKFDKEVLWSLIEKNELILLDFTADWCITCQLNKKTTLENKHVTDFLIKKNVKLMRGDWTKKDNDILDFLKSYQRFGIPVNIIYGPRSKDGIVLSEILTKDLIIDNIKKVE